jgi:hypothetical protein
MKQRREFSTLILLAPLAPTSQFTIYHFSFHSFFRRYFVLVPVLRLKHGFWPRVLQNPPLPSRVSPPTSGSCSAPSSVLRANLTSLPRTYIDYPFRFLRRPRFPLTMERQRSHCSHTQRLDNRPGSQTTWGPTEAR